MSFTESNVNEPMNSTPKSTSNLVQETNQSVFKLFVWPGDWELESLDAECLTAICLLKFSYLEHQIIKETSSLNLFKNDYPRMEFKNQTYIGLDSIIECIKKEKNINMSLNDSNYADMLAMLSYFKEKFIPALNILCWLDETNTYTVIRRAYGNCIRFPLSIVKLRLMASSVQNSIMCNYRSSFITLDSIKQQIISDAKECLNVLSNKLEENVYMFENQPTLLDAYLYGYLSVLYRAPFTGSAIKSHLSMCSNLCSLITRTQKDLFPNVPKARTPVTDKKSPSNLASIYLEKFFSLFKSNTNETTSATTTTTNSKTSFEQKEEWEKRKHQIVAVTLAVTAMIAYAFAIGFIKVDVIKTDIEYREKN